MKMYSSYMFNKPMTRKNSNSSNYSYTYKSLNHLIALLSQFVDGSWNIHNFIPLNLLMYNVHTYKYTSTSNAITVIRDMVTNCCQVQIYLMVDNYVNIPTVDQHWPIQRFVAFANSLMELRKTVVIW